MAAKKGFSGKKAPSFVSGGKRNPKAPNKADGMPKKKGTGKS